MRRRHAVQHEARRGDDPVAAFLLDARQPAEELVGDVLAEARLAEARARESPAVSRAPRRVVPSAVVPGELEASRRRRRGSCRGCGRARVTSSHLASGVDHAPRREVVERRAPQHRLLAAGVHRDVAADARGVGRRRDRRRTRGPRASAASITRRVTTPAPQSIVGDGSRDARQRDALDRPTARSSFSVLITAAQRRQRNRAAGVAGAAAARDDREPELDAAPTRPRTSSSVSG